MTKIIIGILLNDNKSFCFSLILCQINTQFLMIQQKQSQFEQRFNKLNENKQNIIPRVKKQPLPLLYQQKRQTNAKFNKLNNGLSNNPQYIPKNRIQLPDLYVQSASKYSQSADKYKLQSRIPSQLEQHQQKIIPKGIKKNVNTKNNNEIRQLPLRLRQEQVIPTNDESSYQKNLIQNNRQSKILKRRCCHQNSQEQGQQLKRHKSCSEQQILNKLKMRKLQPLKFSIKSKMDFNNIVTSAPQHQMNMRTKKDKVLSKNEQKQLAQKLSKPKQFFHKCDKRFCECSKMLNESGNNILNKNSNNQRSNVNAQIHQNEDNFNLRMKKTRRMIKLKSLKSQPTTIQVQQPKPIVYYHNQINERQYSEVDILEQSQVKILKSRRTLENATSYQSHQHSYENPRHNQKSERQKNVHAKQIEVQTDQVYEQYLLEKQLITSQQKQPLSKNSISSKQAISIDNSSFVQSQKNQGGLNQANGSDEKIKSSKASRTKIKTQAQEKSSKSLQKSNSSIKIQKNHKKSQKSISELNQQKKKIYKQQKQKQKEEEEEHDRDRQKQSQIKKLKISQKLQNSHQFDFVIQLKTSKEQKFKKQILNHLNNQKQKQQNFQNFKLQKEEKFNLQEAKLERTAHFKQLQKDHIQNQHTFNVNEIKNQKTPRKMNQTQPQMQLGLLTVSKKNREDSPNSKLQDSFIRYSTTKSNQSGSKKKSPNQFNKHSSISKTSKNNVIFRVPKEEEYLEFIKKYKCLNSEFDLKNLIVQENFQALSYKEGFYFGQIENDKPHGKGVFLTQRELFQGEFQNQNKIKGFQKTSDGLYEGEFFNNLRHGQGKFLWNNGQIFEGQYRLGTKNGYGKWESPDGSIFIGEWSLNMQHGKGKFVHPTSTYQGDFQKFLKHGKGIETFPNGDRYQGQYYNGKPNGFGKYNWGDGAYYEGTFANGLRQGTGKWHQNSDTLYEGQFFQDQKHGHGIQFYKNGNYFQGEFRNGIINKGTLYDPYKKEIKRTTVQEDNSF